MQHHKQESKIIQRLKDRISSKIGIHFTVFAVVDANKIGVYIKKGSDTIAFRVFVNSLLNVPDALSYELDCLYATVQQHVNNEFVESILIK